MSRTTVYVLMGMLLCNLPAAVIAVVTRYAGVMLGALVLDAAAALVLALIAGTYWLAAVGNPDPGEGGAR